MNFSNDAEYKSHSEQTGHAETCAWVRWVVDGKFYPNPGCTCALDYPWSVARLRGGRKLARAIASLFSR